MDTNNEGKKVRGAGFAESQTSKFSQKKKQITYNDFAVKVVGGIKGGVINLTPLRLQFQIDAMMVVKHMKIKDMIEPVTQACKYDAGFDVSLTYDMCRRFKQVAAEYEPVEEVEVSE